MSLAYWQERPYTETCFRIPGRALNIGKGKFVEVRLVNPHDHFIVQALMTKIPQLGQMEESQIARNLSRRYGDRGYN
jgi:hypothetical protein